MTITNRTASAVGGWRLAVRYPQARMDHVRGALWFPVGPRQPGAGVIIPWLGRHVLAPRASVRFTFQASGPAGPPAGCLLGTSGRAWHRCAG